MKREKAIAYYRVSTQRQGASGLGLDAQRVSVESLCKSRGWGIVAEYKDVESGRHDDRPGLTAALAECKTGGAVLVIAKLDRLARKASFVTRLQDERVRFIAADMPEANEMTVGILAAVAQGEAKAISDRTRVALAVAKARGKKLGNPQNLTPEAMAKGRAAKHEKAVKAANGSMRHAVNYRKAGYTLQRIADELNATGQRARRGGLWTAKQVQRLLKMAQA
ncbi:MAG: recombinase family protein [Spirochaetia bacterium]|jgi:DNA invertase Pin-like site-specific DNA recombinase